MTPDQMRDASLLELFSMRGMIRAPLGPLPVLSSPSNSTSDRHATSAPRTLATPSKARAARSERADSERKS